MTSQIVRQGLNFVTNALGAGHPVGRIINLLLQIPYYANFINRARSSGHSDDQIVNFLREAETVVNPAKYTEKEIESKARKLKQGQQKSILSGAIPFAAGAVAANLLPQLLGIGGQSAQPQPPTQPQPMPGGGGMPPVPAPMPGGGIPPVPAPMPGGGMPPAPIPSGGGIPGMPPQAPMGGPQAPAKPPSDLSIEGLRKQFAESPIAKEEGKILTAAKKMLAKPEMTANMTKEQVKSIFTLNDEEADAVLKIFHDQTKGLYLKPEQAIQAPPKQQEPALESQVAKEVPRVSREALKQFEGTEMEFPKLDISKIKKGDEVITPNNEIGNIEAFSGSGVLVNIDGKVKKLKVDELEGTPDFIKSAKIVIDPSQVEEAAKSAALGTVLESPDKTKLSISFGPSGEFYTYRRKDGKPIDEDILNRIKEGMTMPISTGDAFLGSWDAGIADSRGTVAINDIVKFAQKEGEADDPTKPLVYYKENTTYIHPYIKEMLNALMGLSKQYEKSKRKPKKPKAKN